MFYFSGLMINNYVLDTNFRIELFLPLLPKVKIIQDYQNECAFSCISVKHDGRQTKNIWIMLSKITFDIKDLYRSK